MLNEDLIKMIIDKLSGTIKPLKIILFGSYASGTPNKDSDLDILVVIDDNYYPKDYNENMEIYLKVSSVLSDIKKKFPIDLIVHTKSMHEKFIELGSMFSKEILQKGIIIYEKNYTRVA
ncbi:MAG: nucleotidyltransferase domain-containing protein [Bacteroidia bacterium]|nr:nucleotidyltransferase domain-containing protein [Bacteroidia bacterium]